MSENTGNDIESVRSGEIVQSPHERFAQYLQARAELEADQVAQELSEGQLDRILMATTPEELDAAMEMAGLVGLRDIPDGTEFQINGYHVAPGTRSDFMNSFKVWAVIDAQMLENGQQISIDTGIERVIAYLRMCEQFERFPIPVRVSVVQTGSGNNMVTLLPIRKRAVSGSAE
jgi:hypothetical protein